MWCDTQSIRLSFWMSAKASCLTWMTNVKGHGHDQCECVLRFTVYQDVYSLSSGVIIYERQSTTYHCSSWNGNVVQSHLHNCSFLLSPFCLSLVSFLPLCHPPLTDSHAITPHTHTQHNCSVWDGTDSWCERGAMCWLLESSAWFVSRLAVTSQSKSSVQICPNDQTWRINVRNNCIGHSETWWFVSLIQWEIQRHVSLLWWFIWSISIFLPF